MISRWKIKHEKTKSSTYLLPIFDMYIKFEFLENLKESYIMNNREERLFSVLYKFSGKEKFLEFEKRLMDNPLYAGHEDYGEYVLYKFETNDVIQKAVDLYVIGKFSWYSKEQKDAIQSFMVKRGFTNAGRVRMILDRSPIIRAELEAKLSSDKHKVKLEIGSELSSVPELDDEIFSDFVQEIHIKESKDIYE